MSITQQVTVWCDGCHNWEQASTTAKILRRDLKTKGWSSTRDGQDYCPTCTKERKEKKK